MVSNTFNKSEKLTSRITIEEVFSNGKTLKQFPLVVKYTTCQFADGVPLKVVISIPKRKVKKAVKRNRIRRQLKEAYRLNKHQLIQQLKESNQSLALFFIYTGQEKAEYSFLEEKIKLLLKKVAKNLAEA